MPPLRASQVGTLRAVERFEDDEYGDPGSGASPARVADHLKRPRRSVEDSLIRLEKLGYVDPVKRPLISDTYRLTQLGREALEGQR